MSDTLERAPEFRLPMIQGQRQEIALSDYTHKSVLITFWVTWCPACLEELPQKEVFYRSLNQERVIFLTINVTGRETQPDKIKHFLDKHTLTFPVLKDRGTATYDAYGITSVPTTVLINPEGFIVNRYDDTVPFMNVLKDLAPYV